jgi:pimeloyl-ACP methyl ester carboxylesterase
MRLTTLSAAVALAAPVFSAPVTQTNATQAAFVDFPASYMKGFQNPSVQSSVGGKAICISGTVNVTASANNVQINHPGFTNQSDITEFLAEAVQINSTLLEQFIGGKNPVSGSYGIYSQLCFPRGIANTTTVQFLIHGGGFDRSYWNAAPGYSYVDYAAEQGYMTFLYDRLGSGLSDHPDPLQMVQWGLQVEIAHELITLLRTGSLAGLNFKHVVGVGHSLGSFQTNGITTLHPNDLDAAVLTGFSPDTSGGPIALAGIDLTMAAQNQPFRFSELPGSYLTSSSVGGTQYYFFRAPGFDPALLRFAEATKQTVTFAELFTSAATVSSNFTGPIDVVNGDHDLPNCHGDCLVPYNKAAASKEMYYPAASNGSSWYLSAESGHGLNFHYSASAAYKHIHNFIKANGF